MTSKATTFMACKGSAPPTFSPSSGSPDCWAACCHSRRATTRLSWRVGARWQASFSHDPSLKPRVPMPRAANCSSTPTSQVAITVCTCVMPAG